YGFLPENGTLCQIDIAERKDRNFVNIHIPKLTIRQNHFRSDIEVHEDSTTQHWTTCGKVNRSSHTLKAELYAQQNNKIILPYLKRRFDADIRLDTLTYSLTKSEKNGGQVQLTGQATVSGLEVYHKALSPETVNLDRGQVSYR
ncbi:penicillin-binding domain protein, partial [Bacteroides fragilis str. 3986 N(B)19]